MDRKSTIQLILAFILLCGCLPVSVGSAAFAYQNRQALMSYIPSVPTAQGGSEGDPAQKVVDYILTPGADEPTPNPGETLVPGTPTPTLMPVDQLRVMAPDAVNFQEFIRRANTVQGKNVLLLDSGINLYGTDSFAETAPMQLPLVPIKLLFNGLNIDFAGETFTSTVAVQIDEAIYLPAVLSQAVVTPNLADQKKVVITNDAGEEEVVEMVTGTVTIPAASTCWTGFGIQPWELRQEPSAKTRFEKISDAAYWSIQAVMENDNYAQWALPRYRWATVRASYNAIMPLEGGQRKWTVLDGIHAGSVNKLTTTSGEFAAPTAYDLLLAHFNLHSQDYGFAAITNINFVLIGRGTVYCGTDAPIMDPAIQALLNGPVPDNFLLNPQDLKPALP